MNTLTHHKRLMQLACVVLIFLAAVCPAVGQYAGPVYPSLLGSTGVTTTGSTTSRTLSARFGESVNVRDYGAVCDGSTDDGAAFSAATTVASSGTAKAIYVPPSSTACMLGQKIALPANVSLYAVPGTVTLKARTGNVSSPLMLGLNGNNTVYGVTIDGGGQDFGSTSTTVIQAFSVSNVVLDTVRVQNTRGLGVLFSTSITTSGVRNSTFINIGNHWKTTLDGNDRLAAVTFCCGTAANSYGNFVTGSYFEDLGLDAISTGYQSDFLAANNRFNLDNGQLTTSWSAHTPTAYNAGVYCDGTVVKCVVTGNYVSGAAGNAIDVSAQDNVITGNQVYLSGQAGIGCFASPAGTRSCTIVGNSSDGSGIWAGNSWIGGISLGNADDTAVYRSVLISGNTVLDSQGSPTQQYGIYASPSTTFTDRWVDSNNILSGTLDLLSAAIADYDRPSAGSGKITATSGTITQARGAKTLTMKLVGAGGSAGEAILCGAGASCGGPGGGGGGATTDVVVSWADLGVTSCTASVPQGVAPGGAIAADTTVTCGSYVYHAPSGGSGVIGTAGAATGGGGGASPMLAGAAGAGASGGAAPGPGTYTSGGGGGGSGAGANGVSLPGVGSGGGGSTNVGVSGTGGNGLYATGGGSGAGCNAGVAAAGSTGGKQGTSIAQATASVNGAARPGMPGAGGGGGASSTGAAGNGGNGGTPGGGAGGAGNGCNNTGTPGTSGTSGGGTVFWSQS